MIRGMQRVDEFCVRVRAERLAATLYPEFIPDIEKELNLLRGAEYRMVVGPVEAPHSALVAVCRPNLWATKRFSAVLVWYGERGWGYRLLNHYKKWAKEQNVLVASMTDDHGMLEGTKIGLVRSGFEQRGGAFMHFPKR